MKRLSIWIAAISFAAIGVSAQRSDPPQPATDVPKRVIAPPGPKPVGPYSPGIMAGDFLYISGQGARDRDGRLPDTVDAQVRQTLENVKTIVEAAGLTLEHVVYSQVYLASMSSHDTMDRVWREYFPKQPPARAVLGVHRMPTDTPVEINAVAFRDLSRRKSIVPAGHPPSSPATAGVMAGDRLYLSGSFGADIGSGSVPADPAAQVQLALDNMKQTLMAAGMDFRHVVFVNPYLTDKASGQMNAIYAKHFEFGNTPARATIRVASLPGGNTIEFTGVAVADLSKRLAVRPKNMRPSATASPCVFAGDTVLLFGEGPFHAGTRQGAGHLCRDRRGAGTAVDAEPPRWPGGGGADPGQRGRHQCLRRRHRRLSANEPCLRAILSGDVSDADDGCDASADRSETGERGRLSGPRADFHCGGEVEGCLPRASEAMRAARTARLRAVGASARSRRSFSEGGSEPAKRLA